MSSPDLRRSSTPGAANVGTAIGGTADVWVPIYKWGQRKQKLIVTIFVPCLQEDAVTVDIKHNAIDFKAERVAAFAGGVEQQRTYRLSLQLRDEIDVGGSEYFLRHDHVRLELPKLKSALWRTLQAAHIPKNKNERPDFDFVGNESDESDEDTAPRPKRHYAGGGSAAKKKGDGLAEQAARKASQAAALVGRLTPEAWELPLLVLMAAYTLLCPFNKVEESFSLQATHDLLYHRAELSKYDHLEFPGVVPRSFLGPLALAAATAPFAALGGLLGAPRLATQLVARALLGAANVAGLVAVRRATRRQFGAAAGAAYVLLACCQFHGLFYASRTLPNSFATVLVAFASAACAAPRRPALLSPAWLAPHAPWIGSEASARL